MTDNPPTFDRATDKSHSVSTITYGKPMNDTTDGSIQNRILSALGWCMVEENGDSLAIALCTYFSEHLDCPDEEEDDETGWKPWVSKRCDMALAAIADAAYRATRPEGIVDTYAPLAPALVARVTAAVLADPDPWSPAGICADHAETIAQRVLRELRATGALRA